MAFMGLYVKYEAKNRKSRIVLNQQAKRVITSYSSGCKEDLDECLQCHTLEFVPVYKKILC